MQSINTNKELFKTAHELARRIRTAQAEDGVEVMSYREAFQSGLRTAWKCATKDNVTTRSAKEAGKMIATIFHFDGNNKKSRAKAAWKLDRDFDFLRPWEVESAWRIAEDKYFKEQHTTFHSDTMSTKFAQYNTYCH